LLGESLPTPPSPRPQVSQTEIRASEPILEIAKVDNRHARRAREAKKRKRKLEKAARKVQSRR
jgi:hypothetical protein